MGSVRGFAPHVSLFHLHDGGFTIMQVERGLPRSLRPPKHPTCIIPMTKTPKSANAAGRKIRYTSSRRSCIREATNAAPIPDHRQWLYRGLPGGAGAYSADRPARLRAVSAHPRAGPPAD